MREMFPDKGEALLQVYISALYSHNIDVREHTALLGTVKDSRLVAAAGRRVEQSRQEYIAARQMYTAHLREHGCNRLPAESEIHLIRPVKSSQASEAGQRYSNHVSQHGC